LISGECYINNLWLDPRACRDYLLGGKTEEWKAKGGVGQQALSSIGVGAGGTRGRSPTFRTGG